MPIMHLVHIHILAQTLRPKTFLYICNLLERLLFHFQSIFLECAIYVGIAKIVDFNIVMC